MELNRNSISARVYRNFYETSRMPESLCPYFWKLVAAWPVTILFFPLILPFLIGNKITKSQDNNSRMPFPAQAFIGLIVYLALYLIFCVGVTISSIWITHYQGTHWYDWYLTGFIAIFVALVGSIVFLISKLKERRRQKRMESRYDENGNYIHSYEEEKPNVLIEFIKAKYNKYCPKIDWK
jgi:hypothetical protein